MNGENVYLVDFKRTAFSRSRPNDPEKDVFNSIRMDEAMAKLINTVIDETGIRPEEINDVITGCALQMDENWTYGGRHPILLANLPDNVPGMALDRACSSSLNAITIGAMEIMTGNSEIVMAGGYEHMTHVPMGNSPFLKPNIKLMVRPEYMHYDMNTGYSMGLTAEKLAALRGIGRDEMDRFSLRSHQLASKALDDGYFKGEIVPIEVEINGEEKVIDTDQSIRKNASLEEMKKLKPAFRDDGIITAGNSSPLNAGASLTLLMSEKKVKEYGLKPMARIVSFGWAGVDPSIMGEGPVPATRSALAKAKMDVSDIDLWEINEAFAVVVLNAMKELGIEEDRVNVHGGAIAIGHPLGATGARIAGTLARIMNEKKKDYGVATLCVGGGQGYSVVFERY
ncbi:acetyl-CoA C-acetyltransferase [Thermoplasma sp.]|uniref:acetyl-CoA C-acetyltransferase n=1 Tax=Thermoplasma sp. TaxID=1973142 RepID=UPI001289BAAD|nr:acetyl-CoA C-acetyltransferase [Thermoplasma sp.]KAA8922754.1 MAG: acetyl-CoA C-acetyltransferase [Thermoplasma sp.]